MPRTRRKDGIEVLKADHREVEKLFARYKELTERAVKTKNSIIDKVCDELEMHDQLEQKFLYPVAERNAGLDDLTQHALEEHREVNEMISRLRSMDASEPSTDELMMKLIGSITDHVEEEEKELFPKMKKIIEREVFLEMGDAMMDMKREARGHAA